jgi:hypothetical protein
LPKLAVLNIHSFPMTHPHPKLAIGIFSNSRDVEQVLAELKNKGFPMHKNSMTTRPASNHDRLNHSSMQVSPMTRAEGAKTGATICGFGGGSLTLIVGLSSLLIPGVGQALAVESLLTAFLGGGIAAVVGGLYGALRGWLVPEELARIDNGGSNSREYWIILEITESNIPSVAANFHRHGMRSWRVVDES